MLSSDREKVELYVSCRKLKNLDILSKSDPQVRCYLKARGSWELFGRTETIQNNLNPNFATSIVVDFIFEIQQHIMFEVVDVDSNTSFDPLGTVETTIGAIMGAKKQTLILDLNLKGKPSGKIIIRGEKSGEAHNTIFWQWSGLKLMNTDGIFGKSDPFLRFFKLRPGGDMLQVHETEVVMDNLNPIWKPFEIVDVKLCSDFSSPFRIECWDWEKSGKYQYIGDCQISLEMIKNGTTEIALTHPKKKSKTGTLKVSNLSIQEKPSFIDYIRGGTQLNAIVAIDFTGSNGHPRTPSSLHALLPNGQMNEYQKAISSVCQIILNYDFDQMVPVYGFGGKPHYPTMNMMAVSHCFPCTGNLQQQEVLGLQGIMDVYTASLQQVELSGPTYFAPLITEATKVCDLHKQSEDGVYTILLILTDGEIHDMDETLDAIVRAAYSPLSIVIVGIGNADFSKMEILDGDQGLTNSKGQRCARDLVQFVPFREFNGDMYLLAQRLLAEVPEQLVQYMKMIGKKPRPPQVVDINQLGYSTVPTGQQQEQQQMQMPQGNVEYPNYANPTLIEQVNINTSQQHTNLQSFKTNYQGGSHY